MIDVTNKRKKSFNSKGIFKKAEESYSEFLLKIY